LEKSRFDWVFLNDGVPNKECSSTMTAVIWSPLSQPNFRCRSSCPDKSGFTAMLFYI
jgi:hypothetical protein